MKNMEQEPIIKPINRTKLFISKYRYQIIVAIYGVILLSLCSKSSPLFYFNDWVDANSFLTVGKSMLNGMTLYKDIFEQKGPMLYLLNGMGYLISPTAFTGVFIIEAAVFAVFMIYSYRTLTLFFDEKISFIGCVILPFFILGAFFFCQGGSAEEYIMCTQMISLFYLLKYFKNDYPNKTYDKKDLIVHGLMFSIALLIKYNVAVFWFLPICAIFISMLIIKRYKDMFISISLFIAGFLIILIPWLIYFAANDGFNDFIDIYFLFNIKYYATKSSHITGIVSFGLSVLRNGISLLKLYKKEYIAMLIGIVYLIVFLKKIKLWQRLLITAGIGMTYCSIFFNSTGYRYYTMGVIFCVIFFVMAICKIVELTKLKAKHYIMIPIAIIMFILTISQNPYHKDSRLFQNKNEDSIVQMEFAEIMNQTTDASLLNHGFLDGGFYTVADIIPNVKYFQRQNQIFETYPEHRQEHERYIKEKITDYIVRRCKVDYYPDKFEDVKYLDENYELIAQKNQFFEGFDFIYFLYRVKE